MVKTQSLLSNEEIEFLKGLINKKFDSYYCDKFTFNTMAYGVVYFKAGNTNFSITNFLEPIDYLGDFEDGGVFKINKEISEKKSLLENVELIKHTVNSKIKNIYLVNDVQSIEDNNETYEFTSTVAVIFEVEDNYQIGFERTIYFSEDINVLQGYNVAEKLTPTNNFLEQIEKNNNPKSTREIIKL